MRTLGVEEEFLLVDPRTGRTAGVAGDVLARVGPVGGAAVHAELLDTQVEAATAPCTTLEELRAELTAGRSRLAAAARACGVALTSSGTAVLGGGARPSSGDRLAAIADRYAGIALDYEACGCHVHVGVPDPDTAVAVVGHVRPWLPTLLALSANSPFHRGVDTGYASWRAVLQSRFPGGGIPPPTSSAAQWRDRVARLVDCGVLADDRMTFWMVRPSPHLPTVEFRAADAVGTVEEALLQAALSRALVATALAALDRGREGVEFDEQVGAAAVWTAARYGLDGPGIDVTTGLRVPSRELVGELVALVRPALDDAGDLEVVESVLARLDRCGGGARRQRDAAAGGGLEEVTRLLVEQAG